MTTPMFNMSNNDVTSQLSPVNPVSFLDHDVRIHNLKPKTIKLIVNMAIA